MTRSVAVLALALATSVGVNAYLLTRWGACQVVFERERRIHVEETCAALADALSLAVSLAHEHDRTAVLHAASKTAHLAHFNERGALIANKLALWFDEEGKLASVVSRWHGPCDVDAAQHGAATDKAAQ